MGRELRASTDRWALSEFVYRAAGPKSGGLNSPNGLIAGEYKNLPIGQVPSLDVSFGDYILADLSSSVQQDVGNPGNHYYMDFDEFQEMTIGHFHKLHKEPTGWISTSPSLKKVIPYITGFCPKDGTIYVIRIRDCQDIYSAPDVTNALPRIRRALSQKWDGVKRDEGHINEYIVYGKIPKQAIVATISGPAIIRSQDMAALYPPFGLDVGSIPEMVAMRLMHQGPQPRLNDQLIEAAINVVALFERLTDEHVFFWIVRVLLGRDFNNPYQERHDGQRVRQRVTEFWKSRGQPADIGEKDEENMIGLMQRMRLMQGQGQGQQLPALDN